MKIDDTSRIVIKIGSSLLFDEDTNKLNLDMSSYTCLFTQKNELWI